MPHVMAVLVILGPASRRGHRLSWWRALWGCFLGTARTGTDRAGLLLATPGRNVELHSRFIGRREPRDVPNFKTGTTEHTLSPFPGRRRSGLFTDDGDLEQRKPDVGIRSLW